MVAVTGLDIWGVSECIRGLFFILVRFVLGFNKVLVGFSVVIFGVIVFLWFCSTGFSFLGFLFWKSFIAVLFLMGFLGISIFIFDFVRFIFFRFERDGVVFFLNFWLVENNWLFFDSWFLLIISDFGEVLEKLLLVDLEICFLALFGEVLFVLVNVFFFCFLVWRLLKLWIYFL